MRELIRERFLPLAPWRWTDDTAMALDIVAHLREFGEIKPDDLAAAFSTRFLNDPHRGYGGAMQTLLPRLLAGNWKREAQLLFDGRGSYGNGAAMRVAPLGAYFADDPKLCAQSAALSSQITHAHPEAIAGGLAIALAACFAGRASEGKETFDLIGAVLPFLAESEVKTRLIQAQQLGDAPVEEVAKTLGCGSLVSAQDTVPFCLWCANRHLGSYEAALWETVSGLGDRDTTCAIVGGIVGARVGIEGIPQQWRKNRECLGDY